LTTKDADITQMTMHVQYSSSTEQCENSNSDLCKYENTEEAMPEILELEKTDSQTLTVTGSEFFTEDFDLTVTFGGVEADSSVIDSDT